MRDMLVNILTNNSDFLKLDSKEFSKMLENFGKESINQVYQHPLFHSLLDQTGLKEVYFPLKGSDGLFVKSVNLDGLERLIRSMDNPTSKELSEIKVLRIDIVPFVNELLHLESNFPRLKTNKSKIESTSEIKVFRKAVRKWEKKYLKAVKGHIEKNDISHQKETQFVKGFINYARQIKWNQRHVRDLVKELEGKHQIGNNLIEFSNVDKTMLEETIIQNKRKNLIDIGFYNLTKVKELSIESQNEITKILLTRIKDDKGFSRPKIICLLSLLQFEKLFEQTTKTEMHEYVVELLDSNVRDVRGNFSALSMHSKDSGKYTSYLHIEMLKKYLKQLI
jgi:hypothetical protein